MATSAFVTIEISKPAYEEIAEKLRAAGYDHVFVDKVLVMHGIGLVGAPEQFDLLPGEVLDDPTKRLLIAARNALRSYQYGNTAPDLAKEVADAIEKFFDVQKQKSPAAGANR